MTLADRPLETDPSPAAWIAEAVAGAAPHTVAALVPPVFAAYARVLHPAVAYEGDDDVEVPWAAVAALNGTAAHRLMQWPAVTGAWDFVAEDYGSGPLLAPPRHHPEDQPVPGPAGAVPADWVAHLHP